MDARFRGHDGSGGNDGLYRNDGSGGLLTDPFLFFLWRFFL